DLLIKAPKLDLTNISAPIREHRRHLRTKKAAQQRYATANSLFWTLIFLFGRAMPGAVFGQNAGALSQSWGAALERMTTHLRFVPRILVASRGRSPVYPVNGIFHSPKV
ncbi:MAG: hypothetical protein AAF433_15475, partial [Bacteroidota bacterium]